MKSGEIERESLVISISIPSTACAVRQLVCPNKHPTEGGMPHYSFPPFVSLGVHIPSDHKHQVRAVILPCVYAGV